MTTADREALRAQLVAHEGLRLKVYHDSLGIPTIGIGRNLRDKGISSTEAFALLENDVRECLLDLSSFPWWSSLAAVRCRALIDLRFNLGPTRFRGFKKMLAAIAAGDFDRAADELARSKWATQVQAARSTRVITQLRTGSDPQ